MDRNEYIEMVKANGAIIGSNFHMQADVIIDPSHAWLIEIGDNVTLAPRVHILAHDASTKKQLGYTKIGKVKIGNNVFVGASAIILPNVKIGDKVIIGAGTVVTKNIPENSVVVGNPAKVICKYDEYMDKNENLLKTAPIFGVEYTLNGGITAEMKEEMKNKLNGIGYIL